jgi:hypothetical protein
MMKKINENKFLMWCVMIFGFIWLFAGIRTCRINNKLEHTKKTVAILTEHVSETAKMPSGGYFEYTVNGKTYSFKQRGYYEHLDVLDSVEIIFSIEDPSVAKVVNSHYMDKYRQEGIIDDSDTL